MLHIFSHAAAIGIDACLIYLQVQRARENLGRRDNSPVRSLVFTDVPVAQGYAPFFLHL